MLVLRTMSGFHTECHKINEVQENTTKENSYTAPLKLRVLISPSLGMIGLSGQLPQ